MLNLRKYSPQISGQGQYFSILNNFFVCRYAKALTKVIESAECDSFSRALVHVCMAKKSCVLLIEALVFAEFESSEGIFVVNWALMRMADSNPETILRMNSVASKVMGVYVRLLGKPYLMAVLGPTVQEIVSNTDLSFEIDPRYLFFLCVYSSFVQQTIQS